MIRFVRRLFIFSFLFYFASTFYTRWNNSGLDCLRDKLIYSLPWDVFPIDMIGKNDMQLQLGVLSQYQVAKLLKENPDNFKGCQLTTIINPSNLQLPNSDYFIIRYKNKHYRSKWGELKCYFSCFRYPLIEYIYGPAQMAEYSNIILPYPVQEESEPCVISVIWKNMWGSP